MEKGGDQAALAKRQAREKIARSRAEESERQQSVLKEKAARELARQAETDRIARQKEASKGAVKGVEQKSPVARSPAELKENPP
jgi:hypothetical protein